MSLTAIAPGPLSTPTYFKIITWKQFDVLLFLLDPDETHAVPRTTREVSDFLTEVRDVHLADGDHVYYFGTSYSACYGTLRALEARGLVHRRQYDDRWWITRKGRDAYEAA